VLWDGATIGPEEAGRRFAYLHPCLTPAETEARIAESEAAAAPREPEEPPAMVYRRDAVRNRLLIFAGTLFGTIFVIEKFGLMQ
jgi:hypothetical protein